MSMHSLRAKLSLVRELAKRDVLGRYRGASLGIFWSLVSPFLILCVYTFAFGEILGSRWPQKGSSTESFATILFVGLIVHGFFAECLVRSPTLVTGNPSYVKRVVFPLEVLPWPMLISAGFHFLMNMLVLIALRFLLAGEFNWTIFLLPLVMLPLITLSLAMAWAMSAIGVYFRDVTQLTGVAATALLFTSSAIVPTELVAERYRFFFQLNPLTFIIDQARNVALWNQWPDFYGLVIYMLVSVTLSWFGFKCFKAVRKGFGDVI